MIQCANCETPQFLQITKSRIYFADDTDPAEWEEITERYLCTLCEGTGTYEFPPENELEPADLTGDIEFTDDLPKQIA